jgi:hypothetical protein
MTGRRSKEGGPDAWSPDPESGDRFSRFLARREHETHRFLPSILPSQVPCRKRGQVASSGLPDSGLDLSYQPMSGGRPSAPRFGSRRSLGSSGNEAVPQRAVTMERRGSSPASTELQGERHSQLTLGNVRQSDGVRDDAKGAEVARPERDERHRRDDCRSGLVHTRVDATRAC